MCGRGFKVFFMRTVLKLLCVSGLLLQITVLMWEHLVWVFRNLERGSLEGELVEMRLTPGGPSPCLGCTFEHQGPRVACYLLCSRVRRTNPLWEWLCYATSGLFGGSVPTQLLLFQVSIAMSKFDSEFIFISVCKASKLRLSSYNKAASQDSRSAVSGRPCVFHWLA